MAKVSAITDRAGILLNDSGFVSWTAAELLGWYNDAVRDTITLDPAAHTKHATPVLAAGARQSLPDDAIALLEIVGNINADSSVGMQITMCDRKPLDAFMPKWQSGSRKTVIQHAMYDPADRKTYYVYPPIEAGTKIEMVHSCLPADATSAADSDIALDAQYRTPILDYMLWRAFSKDSKNPEYKARAASHFGAFESGISSIINIRNGVTPKPQE
jgi:hypothetical protein